MLTKRTLLCQNETAVGGPAYRPLPLAGTDLTGAPVMIILFF
jgi:hypothetical protein